MRIKETKDQYNKDILINQHGSQVMMEWEKPYMKAIIKKLKPMGNVLEIGFGLGYSASEIQKYKIKSHTIIEDNPTILENLKKWAKKQLHKINIIEGTWQTSLKTLGKFDCIFFDDAPHDNHPDVDDTRVYSLYHQLFREHVNKNARLSWYCQGPIYWVAHPFTKWSLDSFKIKIPSNCNYVPRYNPEKFEKLFGVVLKYKYSTLYIPLLVFSQGTTHDLIPFVINKYNQLRIGV